MRLARNAELGPAIGPHQSNFASYDKSQSIPSLPSPITPRLQRALLPRRQAKNALPYAVRRIFEGLGINSLKGPVWIGCSLLLRLIRIHMVRIVEETGPDIVDDVPGRRRLGRYSACHFDRAAVAYQPT